MSFCRGLYDQWREEADKLLAKKRANGSLTGEEYNRLDPHRIKFEIPVDWDIEQCMNELELLGNDLENRVVSATPKIAKVKIAKVACRTRLQQISDELEPHHALMQFLKAEPKRWDDAQFRGEFGAMNRFLRSCQQKLEEVVWRVANQVLFGRSHWQNGLTTRMAVWLVAMWLEREKLSDDVNAIKKVNGEPKAEVAKLSVESCSTQSFCVGLFDQWLEQWKAHPGQLGPHPPNFEIPVDWDICRVLIEIEVLRKEIGGTPPLNRKQHWLKSCQVTLERYALAYADDKNSKLKAEVAKLSSDIAAEKVSTDMNLKYLKDEIMSLKQKSHRLKEQLEAEKLLARDTDAKVLSLSQELSQTQQELLHAQKQHVVEMQDMRSRVAVAETTATNAGRVAHIFLRTSRGGCGSTA